MIITCPSCGATASAVAWENDIEAREALQAIVGLPPPVAKAALGYYSLFRPEKRALTWKKVKAITAGLSALVAPGWVQVQGKPARPCPPHLWAMGMEQMVDRGATLQRPLKNHNYLRQIVWNLADQADAGRERQQRQQILNGNTQANRDDPPLQQEGDGGLSQFDRQYLVVHGHLPGMGPARPEVEASLKQLRDKLSLKE